MLKPTRVRHYLGLMEARGFNAKSVLARSDIDPNRLSDAAYLIKPEQCHTVVTNMMRLTGNAALGLEIGAETALTDLGIIGYAMASSKSLRQMIEIWTKYGMSPMGFPYSFPVRVTESEDGGSWSALAPSSSLNHSIARYYIEETLAMGTKSFGPKLTGVPFDVESVELPYGGKTNLSVYEKFFCCRVELRARQTRITVRTPKLDIPVNDADDDLRELCLQRCGVLINSAGRYGPVSTRLWNALEVSGGVPSLEGAAARLSMSPRSLRRHLSREGTHFQTVLDEFRCNLAKAYLNNGSMPVKEVGFLLGFSRADAFSRAFKTWTGRTVGDYQRSETLGESSTPVGRASDRGIFAA